VRELTEEEDALEQGGVRSEPSAPPRELPREWENEE